MRQRASSVEELETEIEELRSLRKTVKEKQQKLSRPELGLAEGRSEIHEEHTPNPQAIYSANRSGGEVEEYERVRDMVTELKSENGKLKMARDELEARYRQYKDREKGQNKTTSNEASRIPSVTAEQQNSSPNVAASPSFRKEIFTPPVSYGSSFDPTSPSRGPASGSMTASEGHLSPTKDHVKDEYPHTDGIGLSEDPQYIPTKQEQDDLTDAFKASEEHDRPLANETSIQDKVIYERLSSQSRSTEDDSDLPVIVSERSLKRKRGSAQVYCNEKGHHDSSTTTGCAVQPIRVKIEKDSSSPIVGELSLGLEGVSDSMDLDEVGDTLLTPRKRKYLAMQRSRHSLIKPSEANQSHETLQEYDFEDPYILGGDNEPGRFQCTYEEEESSSKRPLKGISTKLWESKLGNFVTPSQGQSDIDITVSERRRENQRGTRTFQYLHNKRMIDRQAAKEAVQPTPTLKSLYPNSEAIQSAPVESIFPGFIHRPPSSSGLPSVAGNEFSHVDTPQLEVGSKGKKAHQSSPAILGPKDPNNQTLPRTSDALAGRKKFSNRRDGGAAARVSFLAEDGENRSGDRSDGLEYADNSIANASAPTRRTTNPPGLHHRLGALLAERSPEKPPLPLDDPSPKPPRAAKTPPTRSTRATNPRLTATPQSIGTRIYPTGGKLADQNQKASAASKSSSLQPANDNESHGVQPEHEPLRAGSVSGLRSEDFKLNPTNNQGHDYAFAEVVRKQDQRKCLPGCNKPYCCGDQIRKMVEIGGYTPHRHLKLGKSPQDIEDQDQQILEDYLGDDARRRLHKISEDQRAELLLQAKIELFADEYGRHRERYGRGPTPPGFWRTDFPSTQEEEEDRRQAWVMERTKVDEMYKEAMRPDGRYKFRDE